MYKSIHNYTRKLSFSPFEKLIHSKGVILDDPPRLPPQVSFLCSPAAWCHSNPMAPPADYIVPYSAANSLPFCPTSWNLSFSTLGLSKNLKKAPKRSKNRNLGNMAASIRGLSITGRKLVGSLLKTARSCWISHHLIGSDLDWINDQPKFG